MYLACSVSKILSTCTVFCKVQSTWEVIFSYLLCFKGGKIHFMMRKKFIIIHYFIFLLGSILKLGKFVFFILCVTAILVSDI